MVTSVLNIRPPEGEPDPEPTETTWGPTDLETWLAGGIEYVQPTMGMARNDGQRFIYPGREHAFVGETESGKTWLALGCAAAEILAGSPVLYIHYEEPDPLSTIERLRLLGVNDEQIKQHLRFVAPYKAPEPEWIEALLDPAPVLVIHDGVNEAMSLMRVEHGKVDGASEFRRQLVMPFLRAGAASVACDHVPKDKDARGLDAYGSVHKGNALNGARIALETVEPFGRHLRGVSNVFVTKDRPGHLRVHGKPSKVVGKTFIGCLVADDEDPLTPFSLTLYAPKDDEHDSVSPRESALVDEVWDVIFAQPDHTVGSQRDLFAHMRGAGMKFRKQAATDALDDLVLSGRVAEVLGLKGQGRSVGYQAISSAPQDSGNEV